MYPTLPIATPVIAAQFPQMMVTFDFTTLAATELPFASTPVGHRTGKSTPKREGTTRHEFTRVVLSPRKVVPVVILPNVTYATGSARDVVRAVPQCKPDARPNETLWKPFGSTAGHAQ